MKIALFLNRDLEANWTYNLLKEELRKHTVRIYLSESVGDSSKKPSELITLEYYEKDYVFNQLAEKLSDQGIKSTFELFDDDFNSFPIEQCDHVNSKGFINKMKVFKPDLFISVRFGKIFKDEIIQIPKRGLLNLHSAILPDYKGIMGTLHALKDHKKEIGCTLHTIPNSGIDTGEIINIARLDVDPERSLFWHIMQLYPIGVELIIQAIRTMVQGDELISQHQNPGEGRYFSVPNDDDFNQLKSRGLQVFSETDYRDMIDQLFFKGLEKEEFEKFKINL